ncbi:MAG: hypothetical protein VYE22_04750 [Myxococcota bacterium]|nr:hypothetical protein [Myxococcota bacterium]
MSARFVLLSLLLFAGCDGASSPVDAGGDDDAGSAGDAASVDAGTGLPETCTDDCAALDLTATFDGNTAPFTRAQLGLEREGDRVVALRVEAHDGGDPACPTMSSPTPDRTLIITFPVPEGGAPMAPTSVSLLDFAGTLTTEPVARATEATLTPRALRLEGEPHVAFDLDATFEGGAIRGPVYATHCPSLD